MQGKHEPEVLHLLKNATMYLRGLGLGQQILQHNKERFLKMAAVDNQSTRIDQSTFPKGLAPPPPCAVVAMLLMPGTACCPLCYSGWCCEIGAVKSVLNCADYAGALLDTETRQSVDSSLRRNSCLQLSPDCKAHWHLLYLRYAGGTVLPDLKLQVAFADW